MGSLIFIIKLMRLLPSGLSCGSLFVAQSNTLCAKVISALITNWPSWIHDGREFCAH